MLGYSIKNVDLKNLSQEEFLEIRNAVPTHGVICIKNQNLDEQELVEFTQKMGEPVLLPEALGFNNTQKQFPDLARVSNVLPDGTLIKNHTAAEYWHSDGDFWQPGRNY